MKVIAVTQRVDFISDYNEKRDSLDQRWVMFLKECGILPLILPNQKDAAMAVFSAVNAEGILLTGGNDLVKYGGSAYERDETEHSLIDYAVKNRIPLLGVCRGMQCILDFFDVGLIRLNGHIRVFHKLNFMGKEIEVNSYHSLGAKEVSDKFQVLASAEDGSAESVLHSEYSLMGIMWHPERNDEWQECDINLFKDFFGVQR